MSRIRSIVAAIVAVLIATPPGLASSPNDIPLDAVPVAQIPELDWAAVFAEDAARSSKDQAPRYAIPHEVRIGPGDEIEIAGLPCSIEWSIRGKKESIESRIEPSSTIIECA